MSQGEVAKLMGWSLSKMQRIEGGEVGVSPTDLRALLNVYGVTDQERIERLTEDARTSRRQRYVTPLDYREHLTPAMTDLVQFEKEATSIRVYQPLFYPGFLQTPTVAETILAFWRTQLSDEARRVRYELRMTRRKQVIESADGPQCYLVLDESVIKRRVGNSKVTAEQLEDIAELALRPNVHIRIMPFARGGYMPALSAFQILDLAGDESHGMLYRELFLSDELNHEPVEVAFFRDYFERLWEQSLSEDATRRKIVAEAAVLRSSLDSDDSFP